MKEEFITWEDAIRYLGYFPNRFPITDDAILAAVGKKKDVEKIKNITADYIVGILDELGAPKSYKDTIVGYILINFDDEGKCYFSIDPVMFTLGYLYKSSIRLMFDRIIKDKAYVINEKYHTDKNMDIEELKKLLKSCFIDLRREYMELESSQPSLPFATIAPLNKTTERFQKIEDDLLWGVRNIKHIVDAFNRPISQEVMNKIDIYMDKIRLCEFVTYIAVGTTDLLKKDIPDEYVDIINNYKYLYAVLRQIDPTYNNNLTFEQEEGMRVDYSTNELIKVIIESEQLKDTEVKINNMQEFSDRVFIDATKSQAEYLREVERQKAEEEKKRRVEEFRREILLSWELIPEAENKGGYGSTRGLSVPRTEAEKAAIEERKERVLNEKLTVLENSPYIARLKGINSFEGYEAFVYPDGKVLLEKFYKKTRHGLEPVDGEALYIMTIDKFKEFSKYTKAELRDIKKIDSDLNTINHSKNYVKRVQAIIDGIDYDTLTLEYIDAMIEGLQDERKLQN